VARSFLRRLTKSAPAYNLETGTLIPGAIAAVLMVISFDTVGAWAFVWSLALGIAASVVAAKKRCGAARSLLAGAGTTAISFPLILPALAFVLIAVYAVYSALAIVDILFGTDLAGDP
jgi:hypothetical protein